MKKFKVIGICLGVFALIGIIASLVVGLPKKENKEEEVIKTFLSSMQSEDKLSDFFKKHIDFKGLIAWQKINSNSKDFNKEYDSLKSNKKINELVNEYVKDLVSNLEIGDKIVQILNFSTQKDINNEKINTTIVNLKYKDDDSWRKEDIIFTFYCKKIIDIEIMDGDTFTSVLGDFPLDGKEETKVNIKNTGYYVYKTSDSYHEMQFDANGKALYLANFCPGMGCGGYTMDGTYEINKNKIIATMTHETGDIDPRTELDEPIIWEFKIINENKIIMDDKEYDYYDDFQ